MLLIIHIPMVLFTCRLFTRVLTSCCQHTHHVLESRFDQEPVFQTMISQQLRPQFAKRRRRSTNNCILGSSSSPTGMLQCMSSTMYVVLTFCDPFCCNYRTAKPVKSLRNSRVLRQVNFFMLLVEPACTEEQRKVTFPSLRTSIKGAI
ncbi:hypothetical protein F4861DRAFT_235773 [Xylaria intraflava]|nr:hypothetical protein F4861DRAFT_235773 [Xylaria intraflava]